MKIVVFEGHDYSLKTTLGKALVSALNNKGVNAFYLKIPDYKTPTGEVIKSFLNGEFGSHEKVARAMVPVYAANRTAAVKKIIEELKRSGTRYDVIIMDRGYMSNSATMFNKNMIEDDLGFFKSVVKFDKFVKDVEFEELGNIKPDHIIGLYCDNEQVSNRLAMRSASQSVSIDGGADIMETLDNIKMARAAYGCLYYNEASAVFNTSQFSTIDLSEYIATWFNKSNGSVNITIDRNVLATKEIAEELISEANII